MCGICGKVSWDDPIDPCIVEKMMNTLIHRGPDDQGIYVHKHAVLGHRRLSIIDLSTGRQPLSNEDGTVWVVFNGEIYNYKLLRERLVEAGHRFKTQSDTEVIVHLYEEFGEKCVFYLDGMFAFAIWDVRKQKLTLARDRVGIKPLYYSHTGKALVFASELKALLMDDSVQRDINEQGIDTFLTFLYMPGSETLISNVYKLLPGHYLTVEEERVQIQEYWDLRFTPVATTLDIEEATIELTSLLGKTVRSHMVSDVPVGILLSGGIDSTAVLSFAVEATDRPIRTFTIGFEGETFDDERPYAKIASERFGTIHFEMTISPEEFRDFLPTYVWHMEEPVCEPPAIALYYVTRAASEHVKVLLSGEGGDEAFAGYQNYRNIVWLERFKQFSWPWNKVMETGVAVLSVLDRARFGKYAQRFKSPLEAYYYSRSAGPDSFFNASRERLYTAEFKASVDARRSLESLGRWYSQVNGHGTLDRMLYIDTKTWLPDDLLVKADKMTMANSVELRVPLLDHRILEFAAGLPDNYKVKGMVTKHILKRALAQRVPKQLLSKKKTGFPVPFRRWMNEDLREFGREVLLDRQTKERGYFEKTIIEELLEGSVKEAKYGKEIFSLIILELWHRQFGVRWTPKAIRTEPALA